MTTLQNTNHKRFQATKRHAIRALAVIGFFFLFNNYSFAVEEIIHPIMNPKMFSKNMSCPNCGMMINMWARTRHTFTNSHGDHETCSIRCLADFSTKAGEGPQKTMVASYLDPDTMISASQAVYVIDSKAKGTMTMKSKLAFADTEKAQEFIKVYGGEIMPFTETLKLAAMEAEKTRDKIQANRMKKKKIVTPSADVSCSACGMFPHKFPQHKSQITTKKDEHLHFCSTKCLVNYLDTPESFVKNPQPIKAAWVTVYSDGDYEYANGLYYLIGSKMMGPMGPEAIPYRSRALAQEKARAEGGQVVSWMELTPALVMQ